MTKYLKRKDIKAGMQVVVSDSSHTQVYTIKQVNQMTVELVYPTNNSAETSGGMFPIGGLLTPSKEQLANYTKEQEASKKPLDINSAHKDHKAITKVANEPHSRVKATVKPGKGVKVVKAPGKAVAWKKVTAKPAAKPATKTDKPALTPGMHALLVAYANDAPNWNGTPCVGGNVGGTKQDAGTLMHLKMRKMVTTRYDDGEGTNTGVQQWLHFTPLAVAYLAKLNITVVAK